MCLYRYPSAQIVIADGAYDTNCVAKVCECAGLESPLTPTLSPLVKGGEGREWGDSARAGVCELWLGDWYDKEGLLEWLLRAFCVAFAVEACWIAWACVRWFVRRMAEKKKC